MTKQIADIVVNVCRKTQSPKQSLEKAGKKPRVWDLGGNVKDLQSLERTVDKPQDDTSTNFTANTDVS